MLREVYERWGRPLMAIVIMASALLVILAIATGIAPAKAEGRWTGCSVGAHVGYGVGDLQISAEAGPFAANLDGLSSRGFQGGVNAGCDYQMQRFVIGAFADYTFQDVEFSAGLSVPAVPVTLLGVNVAIEDQWSIGGRAGFLANDSTLLYGLVAYTQAKTSGGVTLGGTGFPLDTPDLSGWSVGAGIETRLADNWYLKGEYRYTMFDTESYDFGGARVDFDQDLHAVRVGLSYRFGASSAAALSMK